MGTDLLLIEDDRELSDLLSDYLGREGYAITVAADGPTGLEQARSGKFRLAMLDVMLPGLDGFEVLRELRKGSTMPVIMLTAKGEEVDRIVGLEMGADDYLPKPFNPRELAARIKAVLRRQDHFHQVKGEEPTVLSRRGVTLYLDGYRAELAGRELALTTLEFSLLRELMQASGRVLSRDTLLDRVQGKEFEMYDRSIDVHISHLRQKLGDSPESPQFIKTVRSVGYLFLDEEE